MIGIYKIENKINHKIYIGKSNNIEKRWKTHIRDLKNKNHDNFKLQLDWNKYNKKVFVFSIIEECSAEILSDREKYWLNYYGGILSDLTYNIVEAGNGGCGDEEWKRKISKKVKENYDKGLYPKRNYWLNKKRPKETVKKMSEGMKGKYCGEKNGFYGKKHTEEEKIKMRKKHNLTVETRNILASFNSEKFKKLKWINNGIINKRVENVDDYLINGWKLGRMPLPQISETLKKYYKNKNKI